MEKKSVNKSYFLHVTISVLIMILFRFVPPFGEMTPMGMEIIGIFIGVLWGWVKCEMIWPSALAFILLGFSGYTPSVQAVMNMGLSNPIVQLIVWLLVFTAILTTSGISEQMANRLVASRMIKGNPWLLSIVIVMACFVCSALGAIFAGIFICWEFVYTISNQVGYTTKDTWPKMMIVSIVFASCVGAVYFPFQIGVVASYGYLLTASKSLVGHYDYISYLMFSSVFSASVMTIYFLFCRFIVKPDVVKLKEEIQVGEVKPFDIKQKIAVGAIVALLVLTILPSILPTGFILKTILNKIGMNAIVLGICVLVTLFRDQDGKPYYTFQELANNGLYWNIAFMVTTAITIGLALSTGDTGFNETFINSFTPILSGTTPYIFSLIVIIVTLALTNLINNAVAGAVMIPLMYSFSEIVNVNTMMLTAIIIFASNTGTILPSASPVGAILAGNKKWVSMKDIIFYSMLGIVSIILAAAVIGIPLGNMILK